jgi:hypothetical protein
METCLTTCFYKRITQVFPLDIDFYTSASFVRCSSARSPPRSTADPLQHFSNAHPPMASVGFALGPFGLAQNDVWRFESSHPSHAVGSSASRNTRIDYQRCGLRRSPCGCVGCLAAEDPVLAGCLIYLKQPVFNSAPRWRRDRTACRCCRDRRRRLLRRCRAS